MASQPKQADAVVKMADAIGARVAVDEGKYFGKGSDATKRAHFKDTTRAWFWADAVIATSTLSVGVNVRIHFARSFLYTFPGEEASRLRELLQGIVRVGRDADDPLDDERIFALISGWPPKLDFDPRPQPARHREMLTRMTSAAAENRRAAAAAQARADARLNPEGMPSAEAEEDLSDPLQSLLAWTNSRRRTTRSNSTPSSSSSSASCRRAPGRSTRWRIYRRRRRRDSRRSRRSSRRMARRRGWRPRMGA